MRLSVHALRGRPLDLLVHGREINALALADWRWMDLQHGCVVTGYLGVVDVLVREAGHGKPDVVARQR